MTRRSLLNLSILFLLGFQVLAAAVETSRCPICGMEVKSTAKTVFDTVKDGKEIRLCSFACARRFHAKSPKTPLYAHDFLTGEKIDSNEAFYLAKSTRILKELDFDMPPSVVAFRAENDAKAKQLHLKDGIIVKGFPALEKAHE